MTLMANPISAIAPIEMLASPFEAGHVGQPTGGSAFSKVVTQFLKDVNEDQLQADGMVQKLVTGETDDIHEVVLSMAKADLSFRLALEVRNQVIQAYQEVSRMQM